MFWNGWPLERVLVLFVALAYIMIGIQVGLFHYRGNFRHTVMWSPVTATPVLGLTGLALAFYNVPWLKTVYGWLLGITLLVALGGFVIHVRGIVLRVGGWELRNVLTGPPIVLPLMLSAISALGLIALYWGR
ncbi:MAG: hypothetical protein ACOY4Q_07650 [Bacillota bacterium]